MVIKSYKDDLLHSSQRPLPAVTSRIGMTPQLPLPDETIE